MDNTSQEISKIPAPVSGDAVIAAAMNAAIHEVIMPVMASLSEMMKNNTEALQYLAAQQKVQTDRMEALEKQIRLNTLVTPTQSRYLNDAIRKRSREILSKKGIEGDKKAITRLSASIRKAVLSRYGIASMHEIPKHEYPIALQQIGMWNEALTVRDVVKEARSLSAAASGPEGPVGENVYSGNAGNGAAIPPEQAKTAEPCQAEGHVRKKYGKYGNVLLTDEEIGALEKDFSDLGARIDWLSEYIASGKGGSKSHFTMIRSLYAQKSENKISGPLSEIERKEKIKQLEAFCKLYETGALSDSDNYAYWKSQLRELKRGDGA